MVKDLLAPDLEELIGTDVDLRITPTDPTIGTMLVRENCYLLKLQAEREKQERYKQVADEAVKKMNRILYDKTSLAGSYVDPVVNLEILRLRQVIVERDKEIDALKLNLDASQFSVQSISGQKLIAKCRNLLIENKNLGRQICEGPVQDLMIGLSAEKKENAKLRKKIKEILKFANNLDEENAVVIEQLEMLYTKIYENRDENQAERKRKTPKADDKKPRGGSIDDRKPRGGSIDDRKQRAGSSDDRKQRAGSSDDRKPRGGSIDDRKPRGGSIDDRKPRGGSIDDRKPRGGSIDDRKPRGGSIDDKKDDRKSPNKRRDDKQDTRDRYSSKRDSSKQRNSSKQRDVSKENNSKSKNPNPDRVYSSNRNYDTVERRSNRPEIQRDQRDGQHKRDFRSSPDVKRDPRSSRPQRDSHHKSDMDNNSSRLSQYPRRDPRSSPQRAGRSSHPDVQRIDNLLGSVRQDVDRLGSVARQGSTARQDADKADRRSTLRQYTIESEGEDEKR